MVSGKPEIAARMVHAREEADKRRAKWPPEVRDRGPKVFSRPHTLHYEGKTCRLEIRSRKGVGFWIMVNGQVVSGRTNAEAMANVIRLLDPNIEEIRS